MEHIVIRKITREDLDRLKIIGRNTFFETFSEGNTKENMEKYLEEGFSIEKLTSELNNQNSRFYFAELNKNIIGYL
jgi:diamine N-acetyltransferase